MSYRPPFYKRFPQDYLSSATTRKMTLAEHGVYNLLLDYAWLEEQTATLPADFTVLSKLTGIRKRILSNFVAKYPQLCIQVASNPKLLCNPRQMAEYQEFLQTIEKNRRAGVASGKARQAKSTPVQHPLNHKELDTNTEVREHQHHSASASPADLLDVETRTVAFDLFWEKWPRKQQRAVALRSWLKIPMGEYSAIDSGLEKWRTSERWKRGVIPHPATWLNQKRWMDEDIPQGGSNAPRTNGKPSVSDNMRTTLAAFRETEQKHPA